MNDKYYKYNFGILSHKTYHVEKKSIISFQRSLAKHITKKELDRSKIRDSISGNNSCNNVKYTSDDLSKYSQLKKKGLNDLDLYKKLYNHRYAKKNILGKFDCYCEKKVFDNFDYINELKEKLQHDKRSFNKKLDKMLTIRFILFGLVPLIGFIIPLLKNYHFEIIQGCFQGCNIESHLEDTMPRPDNHKSDYKMLSISESTWKTICLVNTVFLYVSTVIVSCVVLYIFIKAIKYKKLKAGRDKMSLKEYYHFTKSLL
ncbi:hypothetical protein PVIIG_06369 [Plasmodium vivax India VII]|uniref:Variable surface protein n=1 Tax=Plasmodium vivax India VII TaxID=1077284 RepID=A0A0J9S5S6_PLAVI|nr:hypothetical protein PVIIG_06369 [Plasmodium vivax India VII]